MPEIGSDGWIDAFAAAVAEVDGGDISISVRHRLSDGPAWLVVIDEGRVSVRRAAGDEPADVTFLWQRADAEAVASGDISPLSAFQAGRLRVGGDLNRLAEAADLFARFPAVRS